jgi:hypothetical protein
MMPLVLVVALSAGQPLPDVREISPAAPSRNLFRVQLLPSLMDQVPDDAVAQVTSAEKLLLDAVPDRFTVDNKWNLEFETLPDRPLADLDPRRVEIVLDRVKDSIARYELAARCSHADWSGITYYIRRGLLAPRPAVPDFWTGIHLLGIRARLHLKCDHPVEAIRDIGLGLALVRHLNECPSREQHQNATSCLDFLLRVLTECQCHPACPSLYDSLAQLPRPFLSIRAVLEGDRLLLVGTLPQAEQLRRDPAGTRLDAEAMHQFQRAYQILWKMVGENTGEGVLGRWQMGLAIHRSDDAARRALREAGYPEDVVAKTPALNAAILHGLFAGEEWQGRRAEALGLPLPQGIFRMSAITTVPRPGSPDEPALPTKLYHLIGTPVLYSGALAERQLHQLLAIEALRLEAHRTGSLPAKLSDVRAVPIPNNPITGQPLVYEWRGDVAVLEVPGAGEPWDGAAGMTLRLKLRPLEKKP